MHARTRAHTHTRTHAHAHTHTHAHPNHTYAHVPGLPPPQDVSKATALSAPLLYAETMKATRKAFLVEQFWWIALVGAGEEGGSGQAGG